MRDELLLSENYDQVGELIRRRFTERGEAVALDTLGHEPTPTWVFPNPNNSPIWGPFLKRERLADFVRKLWLRERDVFNALGGIHSKATESMRIEGRAMVGYVAYQMVVRVQVAKDRVGAERALRQTALSKAMGVMTQLRNDLARMQRVADVVEPFFNRADPARPSNEAMRGLEEAMDHLARFGPGKPVLYASILGTPTEGAEETLGRDAGLGAGIVLLHALSGNAFTVDRTDKMIAALAGAALGVNLSAEAVRRRRDAFLIARGQEPLRRQRLRRA